MEHGKQPCWAGHWATWLRNVSQSVGQVGNQMFTVSGLWHWKLPPEGKPLSAYQEEMITKELVALVERVWDLYGLERILEAVDPKLCGEFDEEKMKRLIVVRLWCAHPDYKSRPSIKQAIHVLDFEAPLPLLPPKMKLPNNTSPTVPDSTGQFSVSNSSTCLYTSRHDTPFHDC